MQPDNTKEKLCVKCGAYKPISEYPPSASGERQRKCLDCISKRLMMCRRCRQSKLFGEFPEHSGTLTGVSRVCKACSAPSAKTWRHDSEDGMVICRTCKVAKPKLEFYRANPKGDVYLTSQCASCGIYRMALLQQAESEGPRIKISEKFCPGCNTTKPADDFEIRRERPDWRSRKCRECLKKRNAELRGSRDSKENRHWTLLRTYGITLEQFEAILAAQDSKCAICGDALLFDPTSRKQFHLDHDHATGKIRELLCRHCNILLGPIERPGFLLKALTYLKKHGVDPLKESS